MPAWQSALGLVLAAQVALAQGSTVEARRLSSGLLVLVVPSSAQKVDVSTAVFAGFRDELDTMRGLAHLAEHVAMRETRSGKSLATLAAAGGIATSAVTRGDMTIFSSTSSPTTKSLEAILQIERLRLSELLVSPSAVSTEISRIRAELAYSVGDQHDGTVLFGANRLSRSTSHGDLVRIGDRDVRSFVARYYVPGNAAILIASPLTTAEVVQIAERVLGTLPVGRALPRPVYRDSTPIVSTGRRGPVANAGGYGLAVTVPGLQHPSRPAIERDLAVLRMRLAEYGPSTAHIMMSDQSPASILAVRVPSGGALDSVLALLESRVTVALRTSQPATTPDLLDCEAAGDWRYCLVIATARASASNSDRLDALSTYMRGSRTPLPLWP